MPTFSAVVRKDGSVTLPEELREKLAITEDTRVEFFLTADGQVHFHARTQAASGFGGLLFERSRPPMSIREIDDAIADQVCADEERLRRQRAERPSAEMSRTAAE